MSVTEKTYEMFWDCRFCGQRKNLGLTHRHCPGCGAPQDPTARYFPSDAEKVAVEDHPYVGADVQCPACRFANSRNSRCCASCGSPLAAGQGVALRREQVGGSFAGETVADARRELGGAAAAPAQGFPAHAAGMGAPPKKPFPWVFVLVPLVLFVLGFGGCLYVVFKTRPGELEVRARTWERTVEVERNELERVTAWCDAVPAGSRVVSKRRAQRGTEKIPDGETCTTRRRDQGNGTFKESRECTPKYKDKPVYDEQCLSNRAPPRAVASLSARSFGGAGSSKIHPLSAWS